MYIAQNVWRFALTRVASLQLPVLSIFSVSIMALSDDSIDIEFTFDFFKSETIFVMPDNRLQEGRRQGQGPGAYDEQIIARRVEILEELKAAPSSNWRRLTVRDVPALQAVGLGRQRRMRRLDALRYMQMVANGEFESMAYENGFFKGPVFFPGSDSPYYFCCDTCAPNAWDEDRVDYAIFQSSNRRSGLIMVKNIVQ